MGHDNFTRTTRHTISDSSFWDDADTPCGIFKDDFVFSQAEETFVEHELSDLADLIVERKKEKEIPINFIVQ
jgi:hypothetical protein